MRLGEHVMGRIESIARPTALEYKFQKQPFKKTKGRLIAQSPFVT